MPKNQPIVCKECGGSKTTLDGKAACPACKGVGSFEPVRFSKLTTMIPVTLHDGLTAESLRRDETLREFVTEILRDGLRRRIGEPSTVTGT